MVMRRRQPAEEDNTDSWLMSYADMITLLLAFFVIFVSTSEPKQDRLAAATRGMKEKFGSLNLDSPYDAVYRKVIGVVAAANADRHVAVEKTSRGMQIEISSMQFFMEGSDKIPKNQKKLLQDLAHQLAEGQLVRTFIEVEGHTSGPPAEDSRFESSWELAAARAAQVVKLLIAEGIEPERLKATSFAETRPVVPNTDAEGRPIPVNQARNQRVIIRVEKVQ